MKKKITKAIDVFIYVLLLLAMSPFLFFTGGLRRIRRYHLYTRAKIRHEKPKMYYW